MNKLLTATAISALILPSLAFAAAEPIDWAVVSQDPGFRAAVQSVMKDSVSEMLIQPGTTQGGVKGAGADQALQNIDVDSLTNAANSMMHDHFDRYGACSLTGFWAG